MTVLILVATGEGASGGLRNKARTWVLESPVTAATAD
jgi:hypothetical protein